MPQLCAQQCVALPASKQRLARSWRAGHKGMHDAAGFMLANMPGAGAAEQPAVCSSGRPTCTARHKFPLARYVPYTYASRYTLLHRETAQALLHQSGLSAGLEEVVARELAQLPCPVADIHFKEGKAGVNFRCAARWLPVCPSCMGAIMRVAGRCDCACATSPALSTGSDWSACANCFLHSRMLVLAMSVSHMISNLQHWHAIGGIAGIAIKFCMISSCETAVLACSGTDMSAAYHACLRLRAAIRVLHHLGTHHMDPRRQGYEELYNIVRNTADWHEQARTSEAAQLSPASVVLVCLLPSRLCLHGLRGQCCRSQACISAAEWHASHTASHTYVKCWRRQQGMIACESVLSASVTVGGHAT